MMVGIYRPSNILRVVLMHMARPLPILIHTLLKKYSQSNPLHPQTSNLKPPLLYPNTPSILMPSATHRKPLIIVSSRVFGPRPILLPPSNQLLPQAFPLRSRGTIILQPRVFRSAAFAFLVAARLPEYHQLAVTLLFFSRLALLVGVRLVSLGAPARSHRCGLGRVGGGSRAVCRWKF